MIEPAWLVAQVAPFVCGDAGTLRDLDFALWEMRFTVLLQLGHWKLRAQGVWTVEPAPPASAQAQRLADFDHGHLASEFQA